jgi:glutamate N-acetyltransferase/amino-acid N-acetyltransferase
MTGSATSGLERLSGGVTAPTGFRAAGAAGGIRQRERADVALLVADSPCAAAGVFTRNLVAAAPVLLSREAVADGRLQAVVVNSGNANACTGAAGLTAARATQAATAATLGLDAGLVAVSSTGVIGVELPVERVVAGMTAAAAALSADGGAAAAEAIMTTDTFAKEAAFAVRAGGPTYVVGGMAKGSGMIRPDMATMLGFVTTDAPLTAEACDALLRTVTAETFNRVTVDGDTSTNDMVLLLANGAAGGERIGPGDRRLEAVAAAATAVCFELARMIACDGEGATTLVDIVVRGAVSDEDAMLAAFTIAESPLVKTAVFGRDPNWGRVAMAVGRSGARVDQDRLEIVLAGVPAMRDGTALPGFDEAAASAAMDSDEVTIEVDLHLGHGRATVWTCDLSYDYVRINAEYRT